MTGADPASVEALAWETAKELVRDRDSGSCLACLAAGTDVHHRVRRACGSSADPLIAFGFANTTLLCGPCHGKAHDIANPEMAVRGYRLESWQSPEAEPLVLFSYANGVQIWLTQAGEYATIPPMAGS
jgi:5-methylcytosine-specific restriction endonuclease McrA